MELCKAYLCLFGFCIRADKLAKIVDINRYLKSLKLTMINKQGLSVTTILYDKKIVKNNLYYILPRTELANLKINLINKLPPITSIDCNLSKSLSNEQILVVDDIINNTCTPDRINNGTATCVLNMMAGTGKTFVACGIINNLKMRTLYIVPKIILLHQTIKDINYMFGENLANKFDIDKCNPIAVCVINSALKIPDDILKQYSLIILDEVHMYCSPQRRQIFRKLASVVIGMSATTEDRLDGLDKILNYELAFDGIIRTDHLFTSTNNFIKIVNIINYKGPKEHTQNLVHENTGQIFTHYMHNQFINDPYRLKLVVNYINDLYSENHNIYAFAEEINILKKVMDSLSKSISIEAPELGLFIGGIKEDEINKMKTNARVLLSTYGYAGTGVSINKMSAIIFITPRKAGMKQILARILRKGSDESIPRIVIDIVDKNTALCHQLKERIVAYEFYKFSQTSKTVLWKDIVI